MLSFKHDSPSLFSPGSLISRIILLILFCFCLCLSISVSVSLSFSLFLFPSVDPFFFFLYILSLGELILCGFTCLLNISDSPSGSPFLNFPCTRDSRSSFLAYISPGWSSRNSGLTCLKLMWLFPLLPPVFDLFLFPTGWYEVVAPIGSTFPENLGHSWLCLWLHSGFSYNRMAMWWKAVNGGWRVSVLAKMAEL